MVDDGGEAVADREADALRGGPGQRDLDGSVAPAGSDASAGTTARRPAAVDKVDLAVEPVRLAERHEGRQERRAGELEARRIGHEVDGVDEAPDRRREPVASQLAEGGHVLERIVGAAGRHRVDAAELEVALDGRSLRHLEPETVVGDPIEQARRGGDREAGEGDEDEDQRHRRPLGAHSAEEHRDGCHEAHRSVLAHPQDRPEPDARQRPGEGDDGRAERDRTRRLEQADHAPGHARPRPAGRASPPPG